MAYQRLPEVRGQEQQYFPMDISPTAQDGAYVDMDPGQGRKTRTFTMESRMSEISFLASEEDTQIEDSVEALPDASSVTRVMDIPKSDSCTSLPTFLCTEELDPVMRRSDSDFKKPSLPSPPSSGMRSSASSGCLETKCAADSKSLDSPVSISFTRILRNSFSKLLTRATSISSRSKSPDSSKGSVEDETCSNFTIGDGRRWAESDENLEEIVTDSVQKGLPIIPFAYPTFAVVNKKLEDTKDMIRKNSAKDLKRAFNENRQKNQDSFPEEEEEPSGEDKSLDSVLSLAKAELLNFSSSPSTYVEMSLSLPPPARPHLPSNSLTESYMSMTLKKEPARRSFSEDPYMRMSEDPYMRMSDPGARKQSEGSSYMSMNIHSMPKKSRRRQSDDQMFQLEGSPKSPEPKSPEPPESYSDKTFPRRKKKINIFNRTPESSERNCDILNGSLTRPFKKGNKHKDDYVYVDFEKQNYMDMAQNGSNKWKFLNFSSSSSK